MTTVFRLMVAYQKEDFSRKERYLSASSLPWPERYQRKPLMRRSPRDRTLFKIADRDLRYKKRGRYARPETSMVMPFSLCSKA
ncbi:DUF7301 family protein [Klebsiella pneumoniae]|uniref:DUF7301 family protein n=1 Tax=Klebsiella pneumoniae TaxID=573 RepID=UPI003D6E35D9